MNSSISKDFSFTLYRHSYGHVSNPVSGIPDAQLPYKPTNVSMRISTRRFVDAMSPGEVPDQLDIAWRHPVVDYATQKFSTSDAGSTITHYRIEWSTDSYVPRQIWLQSPNFLCQP